MVEWWGVVEWEEGWCEGREGEGQGSREVNTV